MAYLDIDNLYKNQDILLFKECYCLEKIHGTSAHIAWKDNQVRFFSGGAKHENFVALFDVDFLKGEFEKTGLLEVVIYGEAYGGKEQGMKATYGDKLRFVVFDVKIGHSWLDVPKAESFVCPFGLELVHYVKTSTKLEDLDAQRDAPSVQAVRNGMGESTDRKGFCPPIREGVILRPLIEVRKNNNARIIAKHKREEFSETNTVRSVNPEKLKVLDKAKEIASEWVTEQRLTNILSHIKEEDRQMENAGEIIKLMVEDIEREGKDEIDWSKDARKAISRETALMFKNRLKAEFVKNND